MTSSILVTSSILAQWEFTAHSDHPSTIIPDGCRDLLFWSTPGKAPRWTITSLDTNPYTVSLQPGTYIKGYRLKPGTSIVPCQLLETVQSLKDTQADIVDRIGCHTLLFAPVKEALNCLTSGVYEANQAASQLGISLRTLQRLLIKHTGRTPAAWASLARVRKTARATHYCTNLADLAFNSGYADQSHMTREFQHWLGVSPAKLAQKTEILNQLSQPGYG